jgi:hypothetical protein
MEYLYLTIFLPVNQLLYWHHKYEFISLRPFSQALGGPARYVHFLEPAITYADLLIEVTCYYLAVIVCKDVLHAGSENTGSETVLYP